MVPARASSVLYRSSLTLPQTGQEVTRTCREGYRRTKTGLGPEVMEFTGKSEVGRASDVFGCRHVARAGHWQLGQPLLQAAPRDGRVLLLHVAVGRLTCMRACAHMTVG